MRLALAGWCIAAWFALGITSSAEAAPVTLDFSGTLTFVDSTVFPDLLLGDSFNGVFVYDDTWTGSSTSEFGMYMGGGVGYGFETQVGLLDPLITSTTSMAHYVAVYNFCCPGNMIDGFQLFGFDLNTTGGQYIDLYSTLNQTTSSSQLTELLLPIVPSLFDYQATWTHANDSSGFIDLIGKLEQIRVRESTAVPEPASLSLLMLGIAATYPARKRFNS